MFARKMESSSPPDDAELTWSKEVSKFILTSVDIALAKRSVSPYVCISMRLHPLQEVNV